MKNNFFLSVLGMGTLLFLTACQKHAAVKPSHTNFEDIHTGYFSYLADANVFETCDGVIKHGVLMQGEAYLKLEQQYLKLNIAPQKIYLKVRADLVEKKSDQKELGKRAWLIHEVIELDKDKHCFEK